MRAVVITEHGAPGSFGSRGGPTRRLDLVRSRIAVKAAGINFADTLARTGLYPDSPKVPCVVGYEVAGEVESVGDGVESVKPGDRVLAGTRFNGQAELVTSENMVYGLPERLSFEEGAAFPVNYATAQAGLVVMGGLKRGRAASDPRCGWRCRDLGHPDRQARRRGGVRHRIGFQARRDPGAGSRPCDRLPQARTSPRRCAGSPAAGCRRRL